MLFHLQLNYCALSGLVLVERCWRTCLSMFCCLFSSFHVSMTAGETTDEQKSVFGLCRRRVAFSFNIFVLDINNSYSLLLTIQQQRVCMSVCLLSWPSRLLLWYAYQRTWLDLASVRNEPSDPANETIKCYCRLPRAGKFTGRTVRGRRYKVRRRRISSFSSFSTALFSRLIRCSLNSLYSSALKLAPLLVEMASRDMTKKLASPQDYTPFDVSIAMAGCDLRRWKYPAFRSLTQECCHLVN